MLSKFWSSKICTRYANILWDEKNCVSLHIHTYLHPLAALLLRYSTHLARSAEEFFHHIFPSHFPMKITRLLLLERRSVTTSTRYYSTEKTARYSSIGEKFQVHHLSGPPPPPKVTIMGGDNYGGVPLKPMRKHVHRPYIGSHKCTHGA